MAEEATQEQAQTSAADGFAQEILQALAPYFNAIREDIDSIKERNDNHDALRRWNDDYAGAAEKDPKLDARMKFLAGKIRDEMGAATPAAPSTGAEGAAGAAPVEGAEAMAGAAPAEGATPPDNSAQMSQMLLGFIRNSYAQGQNPIEALNELALQAGYQDADGDGTADVLQGAGAGAEGGGQEPLAEAENPENAGVEGGGQPVEAEEDAAAAVDPELAARGKTVGGYRGGVSVSSYDDLSAAERERLKRTNPKEWARLIGRKS